MITRLFIHTALGILILAALAFVPLKDGEARPREADRSRKGSAAPRPNIIFILADDAGYGDFGCYGQKDILTPNIDGMAAEGMRFTDHYAGAPVCAPSRCGLLTGVHTGHAFVRGNRELLPEGQMALAPEIRTVAEELKEAGMATTVIGKWGLGGPGTEGEPNKKGFDHWFGYLCQRQAHSYYPGHLWRNGKKVPLDGKTYSHDLLTAEALEFIVRNHNRPFFLYLAYAIPHANLEAPDLGPYKDKNWPENKKRYAAMVTRMDADIGKLLNKLKELGIDGNTLVIFTSDNGPHAEGGYDPSWFGSAGPWRGKKRDLYEGGIRVPLVARRPGEIKAGTVSRHVSAFWDWYPTFCELAGVPVPPGLDGISLAPELTGLPGRQMKHRYLYWEFHEQGGKQAVRMGPWKAVKLDVRLRPDRAMELYNLETDPGETLDVAARHPAVVKAMENIFNEAHRPSAEFPLVGRMSYELGLFNGWIFSLVLLFVSALTGLVGRRAHKEEFIAIWRSAPLDDKLVKGVYLLTVSSLYALSLWLPLWFGTPRLDWGAAMALCGLAGYAAARLQFVFREPGPPPTRGLYRYSRNPSTLFLYLFWSGLAVATASRFMFLLIAVCAVLRHFVIVLREHYFEEKYGDRYREFLKRTPRYLFIK